MAEIPIYSQRLQLASDYGIMLNDWWYSILVGYDTIEDGGKIPSKSISMKFLVSARIAQI